MSIASRPSTSDHAARVFGAVLGILVFLSGIGLIGCVFVIAHGLFISSSPVVPASAFAVPSPAASVVVGTAVKTIAASSPSPSATAVIGQSVAEFVKKLLLLLLMCIAGSVIASKGIDLFFKALAAPRSVHPSPTPPAGPTP